MLLNYYFQDSIIYIINNIIYITTGIELLIFPVGLESSHQKKDRLKQTLLVSSLKIWIHIVYGYNSKQYFSSYLLYVNKCKKFSPDMMVFYFEGIHHELKKLTMRRARCWSILSASHRYDEWIYWDSNRLRLERPALRKEGLKR